MRTGIFDLETGGFYADSSILLCCCVKEYRKSHIFTTRADNYKSWDKEKTNEKDMIVATAKMLDEFDILVAHNGQSFDKGYFNAKCLEYGVKPILRYKKLIDPVRLARRHLRLGRNTLAAIIDYFQIPVKKTPIELHLWIKATHNSDRKAMDTIVTHCDHDIKTLDIVYDKLKPLIDKIDNKGSEF